ncbi:MAG: alpha/beta hydrolase [Actinomycetes bacterium]
MPDEPAPTAPTPPASEPGLVVTREIPVPTSVSDAARAALAAAANPVASGTPDPPATDRAAWEAHIAATDAMISTMVGPAAERFSGAVDTVSVGGVDTFVLTPDGAPTDSVVLDLHGGGLVFGAGPAARAMACGRATGLGRVVWSPDYRMPPAHPYPAALDDCLAVYRHLLEVRPPERIVVSGASAGGNLAAALMLRVRDEGLAFPAGLVLVSPEVDLTESGDSFATNLGIDHTLGSLREANLLYADGHDLADPYLSPLFADYSGAWPRTILTTGTRDLYLSNTVRLHRRLRAAGHTADLHVWEAMAHAGFMGAPEDFELAAELRRFVDDCLAD